MANITITDHVVSDETTIKDLRRLLQEGTLKSINDVNSIVEYVIQEGKPVTITVHTGEIDLREYQEGLY